VLKTTARMLPGLIAVALGASLARVSAEPLTGDLGAGLERSGAARSAGLRFEDKRQQADDLLRRARAAMTENDLETADRLIAQAEALDVQYSPMYLGDTPRKLRRELDRKSPAAGRIAGRPGGTGVSRSMGSPDRTPVDPFAAREADLARGSVASGDAKTQAKLCLYKARRELGQSNVLAASYWHREALKYQAAFAPGEDSPEKLAADIRRAGGSLEEMAGAPGPAGPRAIIPLPPTEPTGPLPVPPDARSGVPGALSGLSGAPGRDASRPSAGESLLAARRALALGDVRRARDFVLQAKALNAQYSPTDDTPERLEAIVGRYADLMSQRSERGNTESWRREHARVLMDQADGLLRWRDLNEAERLAGEAQRMRVQFSPYEQKPESLLEHIAAIRRQERGGAVVRAGAELVTPATGSGFDRRAERAVYDPSNDATRNIWAGNQEPGPAGPRAAAAGEAREQASPGMALFQQGEVALRAHDTPAALQLFRQAYQYIGDLDPITARRLQDHLQMLQAAAAAAARPPAGAPSGVDEVAAKQQLLGRQMAAEVAHAESTSLRQRETEPKAALATLEQVRTKVESAGLDNATRDQLLRRIDRSLGDVRKYVAENRPRIELDENNQRVRQQIDRERQSQLDMQNKLAQKVDEFRELVHDRRFPEAEVVAKQAVELAPEDKVAQLLVTEAKMLRQYDLQMRIKGEKEEGFLDTLAEVEKSAIPFSDGRPYVFPDAKTWREVTGRRAKYGKEQGRRLSERELEIRNKLRTPVQLQFDNAPLSKVIDTLGQLAGINIHLDPQGLAEEGVSTDTPINNLDLRQEIKLESALNLILRPLRLTYVIKDEVLKITSEQARKGEVYQVVYPVADLVIPIPNFVPHGGLGLDGAYRSAMANVNYGAAGPFASSTASPLAVVASRPSTGTIDPTVMANLSSNNRGSIPSTLPISNSPGNLGGGAQADFDSLIDLIESTIQPDSWIDVGAGQGSIAPFEINLSLVVSNTQEVHEQIVDLLEQLRRMQDLQVTIEVRFITLNDNFWERIGVDFDAKINDNTNHLGMNFGRMTAVGAPGNNTTGTAPTRDVRQTIFKEFGTESSMTVGWNGPVGDFTADLDIPFTQGSFGLGVPPLTSSFDAGAGLQTGFAILSDIEATFFINAAQRDQRTNVLQAPKVTLFNGQQAFVSDTSQSPFVVSVIPYVGDFASAQQPVIVVLSEGTFLTVQAVVSPDKRFVRLTLVPFFSHIGKVDTFTFQGSVTSISDTSTEGVQDTPNDSTKKKNSREIRSEGTTVQLPTFSFVTVTTTVSVPDGGTVLMGGIKRLSEGRSEAGVPILNKIPYLNRLFKNVGISHETQSLMMMVTPRIIIQEEEEAALLGTQPRP